VHTRARSVESTGDSKARHVSDSADTTTNCEANRGAISKRVRPWSIPPELGMGLVFRESNLDSCRSCRRRYHSLCRNRNLKMGETRTGVRYASRPFGPCASRVFGRQLPFSQGACATWRGNRLPDDLARVLIVAYPRGSANGEKATVLSKPPLFPRSYLVKLTPPPLAVAGI
jgi:hypothetical protein